MRGHNTAEGIIGFLCTLGYSPPTLYIRSYPVQDRGYTNFRESDKILRNSPPPCLQGFRVSGCVLQDFVPRRFYQAVLRQSSKGGAPRLQSSVALSSEA